MTSFHKKSYGDWAGNPAGHLADLTRCCEEVRNEPGAGWGYHQCVRKCGYGPEGAYCKQHDPEAVAERQRKQGKAYRAKCLNWSYESHGKRFYEALEKIANGHNDARGLAQEIVTAFKQRNGL